MQFYFNRKIVNVFLLVFFLFLIPVLTYAQDCCGPSGGGGGSNFFPDDDDDDNGEKNVHYRLKNVRHYTYTGRHPGFTVGLESAGLAGGKSETNFTPRLEYYKSLWANERNGFDLYGAVFYTAYIDAPYSHQIDFCENIAWRFSITDKSRLIVRVDNENLFVYFPTESGFKYSVVDPSVGYVHALSFGDLSVHLGFPVYIKPETGLYTWASFGYEHPIGFGVSVCPRFVLIPTDGTSKDGTSKDGTSNASYSGITLNFTFIWDKFFAKMAFLINEGKDSKVFILQPYFEYTLKNIVFWAGVDLYNLGNEKFSTNLFLGVGYNF